MMSSLLSPIWRHQTIGARTLVDVILCRRRRKKIVARPELACDDWSRSFDIVDPSKLLSILRDHPNPTSRIRTLSRLPWELPSVPVYISLTSLNPRRRAKAPKHLGFLAALLRTVRVLYRSTSNWVTDGDADEAVPLLFPSP